MTFARQRLLNQLRSAERRIWLASPFISGATATRLCEAIDGLALAQKRFLTALDARSVQCGVLDPLALSSLENAGFAIAGIPNLHAKVSLVDSTWGMVGSANLTGMGLGGTGGGGNYEMGVILANGQIAEAADIFAAWWEEADVVTAEQIARFAALPKFPQPPIGDFGEALELPHAGVLAGIAGEGSALADPHRYWINSNYHDPDNEFWWRRGWVSDGKRKTYAIGDLLVVYLGKTNGGPQRCPAILRVDAPCEENPEFVLRERDYEAAEKWPFVTKTSVVADAPPWAGVRLAVAGKTYLQVENGCQLTREEFEDIVQAMPG